ncbi:50S ribosomal protein L22 [Patescibacteria group bacterium]|nr:50S ribosomal protein L22 [Patescibacteria group bacterium]
MEVVAHLRNLRTSPRKVRLVANVIRGMKVDEAKIQLEFLGKKSSDPILTLMNSAIANAKHNFDLSDKGLYVSKIFVNEGVTLKRWIPRAMGRASAIHKRTSHITIVLEGEKNEVKPADKNEVVEEPKNDAKKEAVKPEVNEIFQKKENEDKSKALNTKK